MSDLVEVTEGRIKLLVPRAEKISAQLRPFYNPEKTAERDISVAFLRAIAESAPKRLVILDLLAASGVRGLRFACEVSNLEEVLINDLNPDAFQAIERHVELNRNLIRCRVHTLNEEANLLLRREGRRFDYVDVDPFGSPVPFLESSILSLKRGGFLGIASTDTAPLCGAYPRTCLRRYGALPLRCEYHAEVGLRILVKKAIETAASHDLALEPVFAFYGGSFLRAYFRLDEGATRAYTLVRQVGFLAHCRACLYRRALRHEELGSPKCPSCGASLSIAGPLFLGKLWNRDLCRSMLSAAYESSLRLLETILAESEIKVPYFYTTDSLSRVLRSSEPKVSYLVGELQQRGFRTTRTHFSPKGFRTDASLEDVKSCLSGLPAL